MGPDSWNGSTTRAAMFCYKICRSYNKTMMLVPHWWSTAKLERLYMWNWAPKTSGEPWSMMRVLTLTVRTIFQWSRSSQPFFLISWLEIKIIHSVIKLLLLIIATLFSHAWKLHLCLRFFFHVMFKDNTRLQHCDTLWGHYSI